MRRRQHAGLQKVSALAALAHSSLGPCKSYKLLGEEGSGEAALTCSCVRLLAALELRCAVGQLVGEAVRAHHGAYGTGAGCLLFMAGAWSRAALEGLRRGVPARRLARALSEGLDVCLRACGRHSVRLEMVTSTPAPRSPAAPTPPAATTPRGRVRLSHSRHFGGAGAASATEALAAPSARDLGPAARALSHGGARSMGLVLQAALLLRDAAPGAEACCSALDLGRVETCVVPGVSEDQACVLPGYVVRLPAEEAGLAQRLRGRSLRVVLLTGDLCARYRHLGSRSPPGVSHVADRLEPGGGGGEARWASSVLAALLRLGVELVLVSGGASAALGPPCLAGGVLLVERVRPSVLRALAGAAGAVPVAYASQLSERCVGTGATVTPWRDLGEQQAVCVSTRGPPGALATAVLTGCVPARLQALTEEFWACGRRLQGALRDGALLPGAGLTEMLCVHRLREHCRGGGAGPGGGAGGGLYRDTVLMLMAEALTDYVATVTANSGLVSKLQAWRLVEQEVERLGGVVGDGRSGVWQGETGLGETGLGETGLGGFWGGPGRVSGGAEQNRVYDNLSVKVEAWRSAMDLVLLVLQTDAEVITGVDPHSLRSETDLMLI